MGVGSLFYMYNGVVKKFTFAISSPGEFLVYIFHWCRLCLIDDVKHDDIHKIEVGYVTYCICKMKIES